MKIFWNFKTIRQHFELCTFDFHQKHESFYYDKDRKHVKVMFIYVILSTQEGQPYAYSPLGQNYGAIQVILPLGSLVSKSVPNLFFWG